MRLPETDLFGHVAAPRAVGYSARPGTGPRGQRCNTCKFAQRTLSGGRRAWRCEQRAAVWDKPGSEIKPGAPACRDWQRKPFRAK